MSKKTTIYELANDTQKRIATPDEWMKFLETQAWHYKTFSFPSQLLIYAQRPDTKACATFDEWKQFGRYVKRNSKGIALIDESKNQMELKYVFALEDTEGKPVELWQTSAEHLAAIKENLKNAYRLDTYNTENFNTEQFILEVCRSIAEEKLDTYFDQLKEIISKCPNLSAFSEEEIRARFYGLMQYSLAYMVLKRLEIDTTDSLFHSRFLDIVNFKDTYALSALGTAQHSLSGEILQEIEHTVKRYNKDRIIEQEEIEHEHPLFESERVSDTGTHTSKRNDAFEVRNAAQKLSERSETDTISGDAFRRDINGISASGREGGEGTVRGNDAESLESESGTGKSAGESVMDETHGDIIEDRGRNRYDGDHLSLEESKNRQERYARFESLLMDTGYNSGPNNPAFQHLRAYIYENSEKGKEFLFNTLNVIIMTKGESEKQRAIELLSELQVNEAFLSNEEILPSAADQGFDVSFPTETEQQEQLLEKETKQALSQDIIDFIVKTAAQKQSRQDIYTYFNTSPTKEDGIDYVKNAFWGEARDILLPSGETVYLSCSSNGLFIEEERKYFLSYETIQSRIRNLISYGSYLSNTELCALTTDDEIKTDILEKGSTVTFGGSDYKIIDINHEEVLLQDVLFPVFTKTIDSAVLEQLILQQSKAAEAPSTPAIEDNLPASDISNNISAEKQVEKKKKTADNRNYDWLKKYAPDIVSGKYDYMRFENPDKDSGYMPLYIEKIGPSQIAIAHYRYEYGDLFLDPEVVFHIDHEKEELKPLSFEMSGVMYQTVYAYHDTEYTNPDPRIKKDIQSFLNTWKRNILEQERYPSLAQKGDISYRFQNGIAERIDSSDPFDKNEDTIPTNDGSMTEEEALFYNLMDLLDMYKPNDPDFLASSPDIQQEIDTLTAFSYDANHPEQNRKHIERLSLFLLEWAPDMVDEAENRQFDRIINEAIEYGKTAALLETRNDSEPTLFDFAYEEPEPELPFAVSKTEDIRRNFKNTSESVSFGGPKARFQNNLAAIKLLKTLEAEERLANNEEMEVLNRYVGWGGLSMAFDEHNESWGNEYLTLKELLTDEEYKAARESTLTAFYTPPEVTEAIFDTIRNMGFNKGNILDPCCGIGTFFGSLPAEMEASKLYGIEKDSLSGRIAKQLYQKSNIEINGFETSNLPDSFFDLAIGNVPFGDFKLADKRYDKHHFLIHDYFFAKTLDKVRPGGIVCFITSKGTLDKASPEVRKYIAERADLLGAVRLPNTTFKQNAGTEVTSDILFLQKREEPRIGEPDWIHLEENADGIPINSYFMDHPEMMLGKMVKSTGHAGREVFECVPDKESDLKTILKTALSHIKAEYIENTFMDYEEDAQEESNVIEASPDVKNFSFTIVNGDIYFRENSQMYQVKTNATAELRIKGLVNLRNTVNELIAAQMYDYDDYEIRRLQNKLSDEYDAFTVKFGIINSRANELAFSQDSSYFLLCSLENVNDKGEFISKADIFYKRTIGRNEDISHCDSPIEALMVSIAEKGRVDFYYMQELLDNSLSFKEIADSLKGYIFRDPSQPGDDYTCYLPADEYLSGNVRKKLRLAEEAAKEEPELYEENIKQLEEVLPEWIEAADITAKLGASWIPDTDVDLFFKDLLKINPLYWYGKNQQVHYSEVTNSWQVDNKSVHSGELASVTYGTKRRNAAELLEQALNLKTPEIYDEVYDSVNDRYKRVKNTEETIRAIEKQEIIQKAFDDWVWKDPERRERLTKIYNERFNCIRNREFNGEGLRFHGITPSIELKPHQKDAIARIILGGNTMLAHCVGAGKTFEMVSAAMEMKAMGLSNKNMVVVPNHLIKQFAAEALQLYPAANILGATKKDFEPRNRKKFCSRIATGDYDIVVIGHSQFERIPLSAERQKATIQSEIDEIVNEIAVAKLDSDQRFSVKEMERTKKSLETQLEKLNDQSRKDDVITFEQLGIDRLFIDEAHGFKNLFIKTKMNRVAGLSTASAKKSMDLFMKCRYMDEKTGNRGNIHATGTPVSNSLVELYTTQRYLQYDLLMDLGLHHFDSWASAFTEQKTVMELAPEGTGYRMKTRLAKFHNIPELMAMYKECADIKTQDMLNLDVPEAHYETIVTKPSEFQQEYVKELGKRAEKIRAGSVNATEDNMLLITNDGRKLALDQRLINPNAEDWEGSKVSSCADKIAEIYHKTDAFKGTQLVFCDLSTPVNTISMKKNDEEVYEADYEFTDVYHDLKEKLINRGIPENEIRFIHEANTELQKENLFEKVRSGEVRVLMGSTQKMGAGTNVQNRLYAIHDLDAPWRPSDLEQRSGRIVRQGNTNDDVYIYRYITENTFDAYLFQLLENKQWFCSQIMTSKSPLRVAEDIDEITISFAELKALAAGNPLIKERTELDIELNRLRGLKSDFLKEKHSQESRIHTYYPVKIEETKQKIANIKEDLKQIQSSNILPDEETGYQLMCLNQNYNKKNVKELEGIFKGFFEHASQGERIPLGTYRGFTLEGSKYYRSSTYPDDLFLTGKMSYKLNDGKLSSIFTRMNHTIENKVEELLNEQTMKLSNLEDELENAIEQVDTPFHREDELRAKEKRLKELDELLSLEEKIPSQKDSISEPETVEDKKPLHDMIADASYSSMHGVNEHNTYVSFEK